MGYEVVDYADPSYSAFPSDPDSFPDSFPPGADERELARMREERQQKNDVFQFETLSALLAGDWRGDWDEYAVDPAAAEITLPRTLAAVSSALRAGPAAAPSLSFEEALVARPPSPSAAADATVPPPPPASSPPPFRTYPAKLAPSDFRGPGGHMVCGPGYTHCWAEALDEGGERAGPEAGPFGEYGVEVGIREGGVRMRCKEPSPDSFVVSLDWTPAEMRYQVDRKFLAGADLKGLKTLEVSEVEAEKAGAYRPQTGPENMRQ
ncbi:hypothetical protein TeGR_g749 [Tetraparma gracilis]|uniref:Uncharacterized protein n=1 Tax=Tetraparma gracilis TaxID=2962635 RepID=A0ABQ6MEG3_9STRA|nr:hypothetical protein TeGR_g749 [Tetraparma gracilis]